MLDARKSWLDEHDIAGRVPWDIDWVVRGATLNDLKPVWVIFALWCPHSVASATEPEVVVQGERIHAQDPNHATTAVTVIAVDDRLPEGADVADAVGRAPGANVRRLGGLGDFSAVSLRGAALRQSIIHLDGIPLNPDGSAAVNLSVLPLRAFSAIDVWRGAGPASWASAPIGGGVDLRTAQDGRAPLRLEAGFGSWGLGRASVSGATAGEGTEVLGAAEVLTTRADYLYFDDNGTDGRWLDDRWARRVQNDKTQASGLLRLRSTRASWQRTAVLVGSVRDEGLPGPIGALPEGRLRTGWGLFAGGLRGAVGSSDVHVRTWGQGRVEGLERVDGTTAREVQVQAGAYAAWDRRWERAAVGAVVQARHDRRWGAEEAGAATRWTATPGVHGTVDVARGRGSLEAVMLGQGWFEERGAQKTSRFVPMPRGGWVVRAHPRVVVRGAGGRSVRPPDFLELFGDRGPVQGRPDLRPERATWADIGARWFGGPVQAEIAVFGNYGVDRIVFVQNSQRDLVPVNLGPSWVGGVEAGVDASWEWFDVRIGSTFTPTYVVSEVTGLHGRRIPRVPLGSVVGDVGASLPGWGRLSYDVAFVTGNAWDEANLFEAPPRLLHGMMVRVSPHPRWPSISLSVRNVGNTMVQPMDRDPRNPDAGRVLRPVTDFAGYPLPGRTAWLTLTWSPRGAE